jgi:hypothetical protein
MSYVSEVGPPKGNTLKRLVPILFLAAIPIVIVMLFFASRALYSPQQAVLGMYLNYYNSVAPGTTVKSLVQASQPGRFDASMSGLVYGDSKYFRTDLPVAGRANDGQSLRAVPYPPEQLTCVLIGSSKGNEVIFVALHHSLNDSEWLVHEAKNPWPSDALKTQLAAVGCNLADAP